MIDPFSSESYEPILLIIVKFFGVKLNLSTHNIDKKYFVVSVSNLTNTQILIDYLNKYKLFSRKYLYYLD
jgi:hypothetical protein